MSEDISIIERSEQHALYIPETVGTMKLGKVMGPAYEKIMEYLKKQEIEMNENDIPFTRYKNIEWERMNKKGLFAFIHMMFFHKWEIDIGIPCPDAVPGEGNIRKTVLEPGKYLRTIHRGPYMKVGDTYKQMQSYAARQNIALKNYSIEFYMNDPRETPASQLETEVLIPVR